jgi:hypothetical protein
MTQQTLREAAEQALACMTGLQQHLGYSVCDVEANTLRAALAAPDRVAELEEEVAGLKRDADETAAPQPQDKRVDEPGAQFCSGIGRGPNAAYPGMIEAFEVHYGQSFSDKDWRTETGIWAAAWRAAVKQTTELVASEWDASQIKQPGWHHVEGAFIAGAKEARMNPDVPEAIFARAADGYTKQVFEDVDPESERRLRTGDFAASPKEKP